MTDADSRVPADWLVEQRRADADVFCGVVQVEDWLDYSDEMRCRFEQTEATGQGHGRIHGANLGVSTALYQQCGGFSALTCSEDVALVHALQAINASIAWSPRSVVGPVPAGRHGQLADSRIFEAAGSLDLRACVVGNATLWAVFARCHSHAACLRFAKQMRFS